MAKKTADKHPIEDTWLRELRACESDAGIVSWLEIRDRLAALNAHIAAGAALEELPDGE